MASFALGRLRQGASLIPNPAILRRPTLRREAQSTSALEGTFAPIDEVLAADVIEEGRRSSALSEVLNYIDTAEHAFASIGDGVVSVKMLCELQALLVRGTEADGSEAGQIRSIPVAIGSRSGTIYDARFVPTPPGVTLEAGVRDLLEWIALAPEVGHNPVVAAALAHYQFETLHPFNDGNGRIGRLLIVLQLMLSDVLEEPILSVSPWFEQRREAYQDALAAVSETGNWSDWVRFFAEGIESSAQDTARRMTALLDLQSEFHQRVREANVRGVARDIVDILIAEPYVTIPRLAQLTGKTYQATSTAVSKLADIRILQELDTTQNPKIFRASEVVRATAR